MRRPSIAIITAALWAGSAQAATIVFTFGDSLNLQSTYSETVSGVTLTLANPNSNNGKLAADSDGFLITNDGSQGPSSLTMTFDAAVTITGYSIGFVLDGTSGGFDLNRTGASSTGNDLSTGGGHSINGTFTVAAGQTVTLTSSLSGSPGWSQMNSLTVTQVPEPGEAAVFAAGVCGAAALIRRRLLSK